MDNKEINIELQDTEWQREYIDHDRNIARAIVYDENGMFYFVRAERDDDFGKATLIDTAGGGVEIGEELLTAIKRELKEELGIGIEEAMNVTKLTQDGMPFEFESSGLTLNFLITAYCLKRNSSEVTIQKDEIDAIAWVPLEKCFELIKANKTKFPSNYDYEELFQKVINIRDGRIVNDTLER